MKEQGRPSLNMPPGQVVSPSAPRHQRSLQTEQRRYEQRDGFNQVEPTASQHSPGLAIETIHSLPNLRAETVYHAEMTHLPIPAPEDMPSLIDRARAGEYQAREELLLSCLPYTLGIARFIYFARRPDHDDLLDLVQVASEQMLLRLDRALAAHNPAAYLCGIARSAIREYCTYHAGMIQKPEYTLAKLKKVDPYPATVVSLDQPPLPDGTRLRRDQIAEQQSQIPEEMQEQQRYAPLYTALAQLSPIQTETVTRLYGLHGQPRETPDEIGRPKLIRNRAYEARKKLRSLLANHMTETLPPRR